MPGRKWFSKKEADEQKGKISELEQAVINQKKKDKKYLIIGVIASGLFGFFLCNLNNWITF